MKLALVLLTAIATAAAQDAIYITSSDETCYKVMDGEHDAHLECKPGHLDNAPALANIPPQAREIASPAEEREWAQGHEKRGSCVLGLWACKASCRNMGCSGGRCKDGRWGVCSCTC